MTNKIKKAFDNIHVEEQLKETTLKRIYEGEKKKKDFFSGFKIKRVAMAAACFIPLFFVGFLSYNTYNTESAYVDLDINPSVELSMNSFGHVISANAYNEDGEDLLANLNIKNEKIDTALPKIIDATADEGKLQKEGLISVTVQTKEEKEEKLLKHIEEIIQAALSSYNGTESDIFAVDSEVKVASHDMHVTPAKYLAILDLQEVDSTATFNECRHHSVSNIKERTREHSGEHNKNSGNNKGKHDSGSKNHNSKDNYDSHNKKKNNDSNNKNNNTDNNSSRHKGNSNDSNKSNGSSGSGSGGQDSSTHNEGYGEKHGDGGHH